MIKGLGTIYCWGQQERTAENLTMMKMKNRKKKTNLEEGQFPQMINVIRTTVILYVTATDIYNDDL